MNMIRHDYITADHNSEIARSALAESNKSRMNCFARQTSPSLMSAEGYEVEWGCGKSPIESRWSLLKLFWHKSL